MGRYGKNIMENESDMVNVIALLSPLILSLFSQLYIRLGCKVTNYVGEETPYSLGGSMFFFVFYYVYILNLDLGLATIFYIVVLWLTGLIDDRFGTKYPKGLKGHIDLFIRSRKISTGLLKLVGTFVAACLLVVVDVPMFPLGILNFIVIFSLLILTPHVMNLFDTRPLRVWKIVFLHGVMFWSLLLQMPFRFIVGLLIVLITFIYFEATRKAMLGDNGATLLGGVVSLLMIYHLSLPMQAMICLFYLFIVLVTEKISLSKWIEARPVLKWIDRWGVS